MQYCIACLSSDRRLYPLRELKQVTEIVELLNLNFKKGASSICWECRATLCRINGFRSQVLQAQKIMRMSYKNKKTKKKFKSLSKLCIIKNESYDSKNSMKTQDEFASENNATDCKLEVGIVEDWDGFEDAGVNDDEGTDRLMIDEPVYATVAESRDELIAEEDHGPDLNLECGKELIATESSAVEDEGLVDEVDAKETVLSKTEEQFLVTRMTLDEVYKAREEDKDAIVFKRCPYKCMKCITGYYHEDKYKRHLREKHDAEFGGKRKPHRCSICDVRYSRPEWLAAHVAKHFRRYGCRERGCGHRHHRLGAALQHRATHAPRRYVCAVCHETFDRPHALRYHKQKHKDTPTCDICGKTASTKHNMKIHMTIHTGPKRVQCADCSRWVRATSLRSHRRTHARVADDAAYCAECGLQFALPALYRRHLATSRAHVSVDQRKFECTQCNTRYVDKSTLKRHVAAKHLKIYPFECHICSKSFVRKDRLQTHIMERHEGISKPKDKLCVYCGKGFKESTSLRRHMRTHTGERPYACAHCPAAFAQSCTRNAHARALH